MFDFKKVIAISPALYFCVIVVLNNCFTYNCVLFSCIIRNAFVLLDEWYISLELQSLSYWTNLHLFEIWESVWGITKVGVSRVLSFKFLNKDKCHNGSSYACKPVTAIGVRKENIWYRCIINKETICQRSGSVRKASALGKVDRGNLWSSLAFSNWDVCSICHVWIC